MTADSAAIAQAKKDRLAMRDAVVEAALMHAAFDGWSQATMRAAAADADVPVEDLNRLFPRGVISLLDALDDWVDRRMDDATGPEFENFPVRKKISTLVRARFEVLENYKEATRRAVVARGWPTKAVDSGQSVWRTVDRIWQKAGFADSTRDGVSYYTRRAILAGVLVSTCLYWLEDNSDGSNETWRFLDDRINGVLRFGKMQKNLTDLVTKFPGFGGLPPFMRSRA